MIALEITISVIILAVDQKLFNNSNFLHFIPFWLSWSESSSTLLIFKEIILLKRSIIITYSQEFYRLLANLTLEYLLIVFFLLSVDPARHQILASTLDSAPPRFTLILLKESKN